MLRDFFEAKLSASELTSDLRDTITQSEPRRYSYRITDMQGTFVVEPQHLVRLIDAVLVGELGVEDLDPIGFCLEASDHFQFGSDGSSNERVRDAVFRLANPSINDALTRETLAAIRTYLLGAKAPTPPDQAHADDDA